jgi:hypothetical protein
LKKIKQWKKHVDPLDHSHRPPRVCGPPFEKHSCTAFVGEVEVNYDAYHLG